ncbi:MAG TPA: glycoside hydrolase family 95 protein, partial [Chitinophagaceae bacterium]|nr:glycoside hydrolase family 95 protein [Chitinophagaceae bacterium]
MKKFVIQNEIYFLISCILFSGTLFSQKSNQYKLWYTQPASQFEEALPLGNGRLGIMVYGGVKTEQFSLNEETLWAGGPVNPDMNANAKNYLQPVREALFNEDYKKADSLVRFMQGKYSESYAPLGSLFFDFNHKGEPTEYRRELDIQNAVSKTTYQVNGTNYTRETFVSYPDQVVVIRFTAKGNDKLDFSCRFTSQLQYHSLRDDDRLRMKGYAPIHAEPNYRGKIP